MKKFVPQAAPAQTSSVVPSDSVVAGLTRIDDIAVQPLPRPLSLDAIGQRDEVVRQRITLLMDRLDDARSLRDDFDAIVGQVAEISAELPRASMRIAELEKTIAQEREHFTRVRLEGNEASERAALLARDLAALTARAEKLDIDLREREQAIEQLQLALKDRSLSVETLERQVYAEAEQGKALLGECQALRLEAQAADASLARAEHELGALRERERAIDQDNRRLQLLSEDQTAQIASLQSRLQEIEAAAETDREQHRALQERFAAEAAARQRAETELEMNTSAFRSERASMALKIDAMAHKASTSEQIITQLRSQMKERDEAHRATDRALREAQIAKAGAERRRESLEADAARQAERFADLQRSNDELVSRCDMLTKALAAKDAAIAQATSRNESLDERIDRLTTKFEGERNALELANRRLVEDLENERSERQLVQGALEIARESRIGLQKHLDALKRSSRQAASAAQADGEAADNVHPFTPGKAG
jgi:crescentin